VLVARLMTDVRSNEELTEATASGLRWITIARVVTELLLLVSLVVLARLIPPAAFGMFAVAVIVQELAVNVPSEGFGSALVQRRGMTREHLEGGFAASLLTGLALAGAALVLAVLVVRPVFGRETAYLVALTTPWFLLGALVAVPMAILRRRLDFRRLSLLALTQSLVRSVSSVGLAAILGLDAEALVLGGLAGMAAMTIVAVAFAPPPLPRWRGAAIRDLLPYGGPAALACFAWAGFRNGDYAIVGARLGAAQAGFYWRGFQLAVEYQGKVSAVMTQMAFPVLARTADADAMFALRRRMVRLLTVVVFPALVSLVILAPVIVPWLFGEAWEPAVVPTQILAGAGAATVVIDAVGTVLMAAGRARALLGYGVAHFAVYAGAVLVASSYGLAAVAVAAVVVHAIFLVVAYQVLLRGRADRTLRFLWDDVSAAVVGCVALAAAAWPVSRALGQAGAGPLLHVAAVGAVAAAAYLVTLRVAFPADARDLATLVRRVLPVGRLRATVRRVPMLAGRSS
jgi:O-antigen/teichoic acid export membrane protein